MKNIIVKLLSVAVLLGFAVLSIHSNINQRHQLYVQEVELNARQLKIKKLDAEFKQLSTELDNLKNEKNANIEKIKELEQQREKLELEKQELNRQLQAKLERKKKEAQQAQIVSASYNTQNNSAAYTPPAIVAERCEIIANKLRQAGLTEAEISPAIHLTMRESTCNEYVVNEIGACGALQSNPCGKWGQMGTLAYYQGANNYVKSRYGSWQNALNHSLANNWY